MSTTNRSALFVDGNNWYHALSEARVASLGRLSYTKIAAKLVKPREWIGLRYYIGQVPQVGNTQLYADQRRFLSRLAREDPKISIHLGRLEPREQRNDLAKDLLAYLAGLGRREVLAFRQRSIVRCTTSGRGT